MMEGCPEEALGLTGKEGGGRWKRMRWGRTQE